MERVKIVSMIGWKPPTSNMVKVNTNGASKNHMLVGCDGIIRDTSGCWLSDFAKYMGNYSALMTKLWGFYEGLGLIKLLFLNVVELNMDSMVVVQAVVKGRSSRVYCLDLIKHI